jgi:hypothetical protein
MRRRKRDLVHSPILKPALVLCERTRLANTANSQIIEVVTHGLHLGFRRATEGPSIRGVRTRWLDQIKSSVGW